MSSSGANSGIGTPATVTAQPAANGTVVTLPVTGLTEGILSTSTAGFTGSVTLAVQASYDGGVTFNNGNLTLFQLDSQSPGGAGTVVVTTVNHGFAFRCAGATHVRVVASGYAAGGVNPTITLTALGGDFQAQYPVELYDSGNNPIRAGAASQMTGVNNSNTAVMAIPPGETTVTNTPAANTQATATAAAGGGTVRHVCRSVTMSFAAGATPGAATQVNLRDGASGAGTILRSWIIAAPAGDSRVVSESNLSIPGSANTAMTLEFAAAGGATTLESVSFSYVNAS